MYGKLEIPHQYPSYNDTNNQQLTLPIRGYPGDRVVPSCIPPPKSELCHCLAFVLRLDLLFWTHFPFFFVLGAGGGLKPDSSRGWPFNLPNMATDLVSLVLISSTRISQGEQNEPSKIGHFEINKRDERDIYPEYEF